TGGKGEPVTVQPGQVAHAPVGFVRVQNYDPADCKPTPVRGLRVYPPQETNSMFVPAEGTGCAANPEGQQLTGATTQPGRGRGRLTPASPACGPATPPRRARPPPVPPGTHRRRRRSRSSCPAGWSTSRRAGRRREACPTP